MTVRRIVPVLLLAGLAASACVPVDAAPVGRSPAPAADPVASARSDLAAVPIRAIRQDPSYRRAAFGQAWSDAGTSVGYARNGCDTRNDILARDARLGSVRFKPGTGGCKVLAGEWTSPYTGAKVTVPRQLDVDHVLPLGRAWASGADTWSSEQRLNFANDPDNLLAVDAHSNRSKGDSGPGAWRPKRPHQCGYALAYLRPVVKYRLPITSADAKALHSMLDTCTTTSQEG